MSAKWIVVTGLDGSGKTTLVENLKNWLIGEKNNIRIKDSRLPHDEHLVKNLLNVSKNSYTDRMIFALDNRIFGERFTTWQKEYDIIITQRGYLDSFVHGAVQGYAYSQIAEINQISDLPKCDIMVHLVAEAGTAYGRIKDDPEADKFEYIEYMRKQEKETRRAFYEITNQNVDLNHFKECQNILIDTTDMTTEETFQYAKKKLKKLIKI